MSFCAACETYLAPNVAACPICAVPRRPLTSITPVWSKTVDQLPSGAPLVAGDQLLIPTREASRLAQHSSLHALNLTDGSPRWRRLLEYSRVSCLMQFPKGSEPSGSLILVATASTDLLRGEGALLALDAAGEELWCWAPGVQYVSAPALVGEMVGVTADARTLVVIDLATGNERTRIALEVSASLAAPALVGDIAFVPCRGPHLPAVGLDGQMQWRFDANEPPNAWLDQTPVVVGDYLFTVLSAGKVLALRVQNGSLAWQTQVGPEGKRLSPPATNGERLYVGARDGLYALDLSNGNQAWSFPTSRRVQGAPVLVGDVVYFTCHDHLLYALDAATGQELWRYQVERRIEVAPCVKSLPHACVFIADHGGTLTAVRRPLSAAEYEAAGHWVEAAAACAALGQFARGAELLETHGDPFKAAELWKAAGEPERAATQYEVAGAWQRAADLWDGLDRMLKRAEALEGYARSLADGSYAKAEQAEAWTIAAQAFEAAEDKERVAICQRKVARCLRLAIITVDVEHEGLVLEAWSRLRFITRNEGYGPARNLMIRVEGDQFKGQVMHTQRITTLRAGREHIEWLDVYPREYGSDVPLRVIVEYEGQAKEAFTHEQTIYIPVARIEADRGANQVIRLVLEDQISKIRESSMSIKILFLAANPTDSTRLRLDEESRAIDQALRQAEYRDRFDIRQHWAVRVTDLQGYLLRHRPDIVHFSGHGGQSSEIILEDSSGKSNPVSVRALSTLFSVLKDNIRCVVLNACYSEQQARAIAKHVDCVIGMSRAIGDKAAITFAAAFYQALGYGRDVQTAFDLGCVQVDMENLDEQDTPKLLAVKNDPKNTLFVHND